MFEVIIQTENRFKKIKRNQIVLKSIMFYSQKIKKKIINILGLFHYNVNGRIGREFKN